MINLAFGLLVNLVDGMSTQEIVGIGVTGQMHGMALLDDQDRPCSDFIGWQDQRGNEIHSDDLTYVQRMRLVVDTTKPGSRPSTGYMGTTLFCLSEQGRLPAKTQACFAPDYLLSRLCQSSPVTDPTNAASAGLFSLQTNSWEIDLLQSLGLPTICLSPVVDACTVVSPVKKLTPLAGIPVSVASGDNQASFAGSVADPQNSILINVGTGGQISAFVPDLRPFLSGGYLLVGAGLCGGRSYRALHSFVQQIGESVFGVEVSQDSADLYSILNRLADGVPARSDGLRCQPVFSGSRQQPDRRGVWSGISETNFTIGHFARSLLEGVVTEFDNFYHQMQKSGLSARPKLVGSGNGIRQNRVLQQAIEGTFLTSVLIPVHTEEAAVGTALVCCCCHRTL